jgi:predicted Zn-dependent protease
MKLGVLPIGKADRSIMVRIKENLARVFQDIVCVVVEEHFPLLEEAFDEKRQQYQSYVILREVQGYAVRKASVNIVLGVVDADIFW